MKHPFTSNIRLLRTIIPAFMITLFVLAGCSNSTELDVNRIIKTDTVTSPAQTSIVHGSAALISAADTVADYIVIIDSNQKFDTTNRLASPGVDSVRTITFVPAMTALVTIDTAVFPPVIQQLSGSWWAGYDDNRLFTFYSFFISQALLTLDSVTARPGLTFTAAPPNPCIILTVLGGAFPGENGVIDSLRFTVKSVTPPLPGKPGSGQILIAIACASPTKFTAASPQQGMILKRSIALRMGATLRISY